MKNSELWYSYSLYTSEFTKFSRQLAFAAAAICWLFKSPELSFPQPILMSLAFLVSFFCLDIFQFFSSAHLLRWWIRREEKKMWKTSNTLEGEYNKPWWVDSPAFIFFNLKAIALLCAFMALSVEFIKRF